MAQKLYEESNIQAIANAIRAKNGLTETYKTSEMAGAIEAIETGGGELPEEVFVISGKADYMFQNGYWDWFIESYGNKIVTENLGLIEYMFKGSKLEVIPFDIVRDNSTAQNERYVFEDCNNLKEIKGKLINFNPIRLSGVFDGCNNLRYLPELVNITTTTLESSKGYLGYMFSNCWSLRKIPNCWLKLKAGMAGYYSMYGGSSFQNLYSIDEINGLSVSNATSTSNEFSSDFSFSHRLKNMTFETNEDRSPKTANWVKQTIDLSKEVGYARESWRGNILNHNSGITADKEVKDDATYQALKNDPDWFTTNINYSRYNHDSAVTTINSLPDTSAYLATAGGTNTIIFEGDSGGATDGGAINTLTAEEIAVAAAKGWTVTLS